MPQLRGDARRHQVPQACGRLRYETVLELQEDRPQLPRMQGKAKVVAAVGPEEPLIIAHVGLDGFAAVKRGARVQHPTPRPAILGDYMQQLRGRNVFAALTDDRLSGHPDS